MLARQENQHRLRIERVENSVTELQKVATESAKDIFATTCFKNSQTEGLIGRHYISTP